jgi:uncharacterized repeat protein (TIGR01451 family)
MSHTESGSRSTGRRGLVRILGSFALVCAALVAPAIAHADTRTATVTLSNPLITPVPLLQGGFGQYNFTVSNVAPDATFPFTAGAKVGHCVDLTQDPGTKTVTLRTAPDFTGTVAANPNRIQWLLESSAANSPLNATQAAAHQSAIWQVTNPGEPAALLTDAAGKAIAAQLFSDSATYAADATTGASVNVQGGANTTSCAGTTRTIVVTGTPFTTSTLTITSGVGTFVSTGTTTTQVTIGPDGTATAVLQSNVNNPGAITVSANITISTMVQSDGGATQSSPASNQDFAYLVNQQMTRTVTVTFTDCRLTVSKTAEPKFNRTFTWNVQKIVTSQQQVTADGGTTINYTYQVTATKSAPIDSGWTVSGTIAVTNPGPATTATVADGLPGATCTVASGGASTTVSLAQGATTNVPYVCSYATQPTYNVAQTNTATISWQLPGGTPISVTATAPFTFADGTTGNPTTTGDSADVTDAFNGGTPVDLGTVNQTTSINTSSSYTVPTTMTNCIDLPNTATVTSNGASATSTATVTACITPAKVVEQGKPAVTPTTVMTLTKSADVSVVKPGGLVHFTIHWKNTGKSAAKNVLVCDRLPAGMTFSSAPGATFKSGKACWTKSSVAIGGSLSFAVVAKVDSDAGAQTFTNVATAAASNAKSVEASAKVRSLPQRKARPGGVTG